jgi:hypothetical protein
VPGRPEHLSSLSDNRLDLQRECHSKTPVWLEECSPKASKHFKGFGSGFTEFHTIIDADTLLNLPSIADKTKYDFKKALL